MSEGKKPRGFAAMSREAVSELARKGGVVAHAEGVAHEWTREEAREAGRKGGRRTHELRRAAREASCMPLVAGDES